jgi:hypothetical protein
MAKFFASCFCAFLLLGFVLPQGVRAVSPLSVNLAVEPSIYRLLYNPPSIPQINVVGNLTLDGSPVSDGLVGLTLYQIGSRTGAFVRTIFSRTLSTGSLPPQNWSLNLSLDVLAFQGVNYVPATVFHRPSTQADPGPAFSINCTNSDLKPVLWLSLTVFDSSNALLSTYNTVSYNVPANQSLFIIVPPLPLVDWVALGNATVHLSAFDNVPPSIGFPYCPEVSKQFLIVNSTGGLGALSQETMVHSTDNAFSSTSGNFGMAVGFPFSVLNGTSLNVLAWGNYTFRASARYQGYNAAYNFKFVVRIPGDLNGDGVCSIGDAGLVTSNWQKTVPPADPRADYNGDGRVNVLDVGPITAYWQKRAQF